MKWITFFCLANLLLPAPMSATGQVAKDSLDALVRQLGNTLMQQKPLVGASIGVYTGAQSYFYNFGTVDKKTQAAPTEHTRYEIGSITKTFVSFLLAKAVTEKRISLTDDVRKYLGESYPNLEHSGKPIQIIHLANTSSGLPDWLPPVPESIQKASVDSVSLLSDAFFRKATMSAFFKALHGVQLAYAPGTQARHSNAGAILLGYILEKVYQKSLERLLNGHIAKPGGLKETAFFTASVPDIAIGYNAKGEEMPYGPSFGRASGGIVSSSADLLAYAKFLLENTSQAAQLVLSRTLEVDMQTNQSRQITEDVPFKASAYCIALNWYVYRFDNGITQIWTNGGTSGFNSYLVLFPTIKSAVVVLANVSDEKVFKSLPNITYSIRDLLGKHQKP